MSKSMTPDIWQTKTIMSFDGEGLHLLGFTIVPPSDDPDLRKKLFRENKSGKFVYTPFGVQEFLRLTAFAVAAALLELKHLRLDPDKALDTFNQQILEAFTLIDKTKDDDKLLGTVG